MTIAMLRNQGIKATKMEDVAFFLQISKRTLYELFPNKNAFLLECIKYEIKKEEEIINRLELKSKSPLKFIVRLYSHATRFFHSFHPAFFKDLRRFPECSKELDRYIIMLKKKINDLLHESISLGLCIKECDTFLFSAFLSMRLEDIKNGLICHKEKINGISKFVAYSMLLGYSTDEGKKQLL